MTKKIYIVGIEGAGTSALAQIYKYLGYEVSGSDNGDHFYANILQNAGIQVFGEFNANNIPESLDFAVYSSAFREDNVEIAELKKRGVKLYTYSQALGKIFDDKIGIAVCGTHGKTTTTAMLAQALENAGKDPLALVGSNVIDWNSNVLLGKGEYFVAESDEYQNKLQYYQPWSAILTSVDWDHPDFFPDFEAYKKVFKEFVAKIPKTGFLVVWGDSTDTLEVAKEAKCEVLTYGFSSDCAYRIENKQLTEKDGKIFQTFELYFEENLLGNFQTPLVGKHNVLNAAAVLALAHAANFDLEKIAEALGKFKGTTRRFEYVGKFGNVILMDDYAHHPDEIKTTLAGAKEHFAGKKIWTVFHPHTFSRTKALLEDFAQSFDDTDKVIVIDTYGSARENEGEITSEDLVKLINKYNFGKAEYIPSMEETVEYLKENAEQFEILLTMGAGDVWRVGQKLKD